VVATPSFSLPTPQRWETHLSTE
jgi:hypothetical protein